MQLTPEFLGTWVSALLTLMVLSYLLGDNPLFRLAEHLFVGTAAGYVVLVGYYSVLRPKLIAPLMDAPAANWTLFVPLILAALLVVRLRPGWGRAGSLPLALLLGVGAALAVGGALFGTLLPQAGGTMVSLNAAHGGGGAALSNLVLVVGTLSALFYFHFTSDQGGRLGRIKSAALRGFSKLGLGFIMVAFGSFFASTVVSRASLLVGRVQFLLVDWLGLNR